MTLTGLICNNSSCDQPATHIITVRNRTWTPCGTHYSGMWRAAKTRGTPHITTL